VKPQFVLTATSEVWKRMGDGELPAAKAMVTRKVKFRGPMAVAMAHLPSLEAAMRMFGQVEDTDWRV
jgi:putative sterol carrier protein